MFPVTAGASTIPGTMAHSWQTDTNSLWSQQRWGQKLRSTNNKDCSSSHYNRVHWCHLAATSLEVWDCCFQPRNSDRFLFSGQHSISTLHLQLTRTVTSPSGLYTTSPLCITSQVWLGLPSLNIRYSFSLWALQIFQKVCINSPF